MTEKLDYSPGLEGIIAGESAISRIDADRNRLIIRGYDLVDLAQGASYEEVAYLLLYGDLPSASQLQQLEEEIRSQRTVPQEIMDMLAQAPASLHPMALLRTGVSALAFEDAEAAENAHDANVRKAIRLIAKIPTIITAGYRLACGDDPVAPDDSLNQAANLLYMLRGSPAESYESESMNVSLILYAEHGFNASTFTARVVASTTSDLHAAVTAAVGALAGPLHGGANEKAMEMLLEIGDVDKGKQFVLDALEQKRKIMGFGHREYKKGDSRVPIMKQLAETIASAIGDRHWLELGDVVENTMMEEKKIIPNVDYPCGYTYYMMKIPIPLYTPIFVSSRVAGWSAHVIEQHDGNRIIRPDHIYTGPERLVFKDLKERA
jgi:2-methylcitrate synthase/citrate synthase II